MNSFIFTADHFFLNNWRIIY